MQKVTPITVNIEKYIIDQIQSAGSSIYIAVAWFTSSAIKRALLEKKSAKPEIMIEIVVDDNDVNEQYFLNDLDLFQRQGITIHKKAVNKFLHVKYMIIDGKRVLEGSYNFTEKAKRNQEHAALIKDNQYAAFQIRLFRVLTDAQYLDANIHILLNNLSFTQGILSAYYPFTRVEYRMFQKKITSGYCYTADIGNLDRLYYAPGFIFNPVCQEEFADAHREFNIPISRETLMEWYQQRGEKLSFDYYADHLDYVDHLTDDLDRNAQQITEYFEEKLANTFSEEELQTKIDQNIDVIIGNGIWDFNFMPFMNAHAFSQIMNQLPEVSEEVHWPLSRNVLKRK